MLDAAKAALRAGCVIPAHPLALGAGGAFDEDAQARLTRHYLDAGAGGVAVGVHTTQFEIREHGLLEPVLAIAAEEIARFDSAAPHIKVAGICGPTAQAVAEATLARDRDYDLALVSLAALGAANDDALIGHCRAIGEVLPLFGFYLQPAVGGRVLGVGFWRRFAALPSVAAIKIAPFDRYRTIDVVRAVAEVGRAGEIALYTGNDDNILADLLTEFRFEVNETTVAQRIVGGLLGQWAVWTARAVELHARCRAATAAEVPELLALGAQLTDANAALFDVAHGFRGCIAGIHEVLFRQGLVPSVRCLDPDERLSPGQSAEIDRVLAAYPHLVS